MAYGNRYYAGWHNSTLQGYLYIDKFSYVGSPEEVRLLWDGISVVSSFADWNNPIVGLRCDFEIINDRADFFDLLPLLISEEREYLIRVVVTNPTTYTLFEGFINCDTVTQKFLHRQSIRVTASSYLSKLDNMHPECIDTLINMPFITVIDEILRATGGIFNIRVNCRIHAEGDILNQDQTLFSKNGFYTELFWKDEIERYTNLEILTKILTTFDCYIYWFDGFWYIERYEDIWQEGGVNFVEYTTDVIYTPEDSASHSPIVKSAMNLHDLVFTNQSQTLHCIPGLNTVKVTLEDQRLQNLIYSDLSIASGIGIALTEPIPNYRDWLFMTGAEFSWTDLGLPKSVIKNAIKRTLNYTETILTDPWLGLYTMFKITADGEETELNISFKYITESLYAQGTDGWTKYKFTFYWYLRVIDPVTGYICNSGKEWILLDSDTPENCLQKIEVEGSAFDPIKDSYEVSISIPIGKVQVLEGDNPMGPMLGDYSVVLCIGTEQMGSDDTDGFVNPYISYFGDFVVTASGDDQDNVIEGTISTKFLNKKDISLMLYDMDSYSYKNGIFRADSAEDLNIRTERWGSEGGESHIVERGVCYAKHTVPTVDDLKKLMGTGYGSFSGLLTHLDIESTYYARAYGIDEDGAIYYGDEEIINTQSLAVGSAYQGGQIAHIFTPDEPANGEQKGYVEGYVSGIIAAWYDVDHVGNWSDWWGSLSVPHPISPGAYKYEIGWAKHNTDLINGNINQCDFVAKKVRDYKYGIYTDWLWPTIDELWILREHKLQLFLTNDWYWSSTEIAEGSEGGDPFFEGWVYPVNSNRIGFNSGQGWKYSWALNFANNSKKDWWKKHNEMRVRPIRYFSEPL